MVIILDTFPASSAGKLPTTELSELDRCRRWIADCELSGHRLLVPAIVYFEALRELELRQATRQIERLQAFCLQSQHFLPLTTEHLELAAKLWGQSRRNGTPLADPKALDGDTILCAQVRSLDLSPASYVVATTNPGHLSQFVNCVLWDSIVPNP